MHVRVCMFCVRMCVCFVRSDSDMVCECCRLVFHVLVHGKREYIEMSIVVTVRQLRLYFYQPGAHSAPPIVTV